MHVSSMKTEHRFALMIFASFVFVRGCLHCSFYEINALRFLAASTFESRIAVYHELALSQSVVPEV